MNNRIQIINQKVNLHTRWSKGKFESLYRYNVPRRFLIRDVLRVHSITIANQHDAYIKSALEYHISFTLNQNILRNYN